MNQGGENEEMLASEPNESASFGVVYEEDGSLIIPNKEDISRLELTTSLDESGSKADSAAEKRRTSRKDACWRMLPRGNQIKDSTKTLYLSLGKSVRRPFIKLNLIFMAYRVPVVSSLIIIALAFTFLRGVEAKSGADQLMVDAENHLTVALEFIDEGKTAEALREADAAKKSVGELKILLQSWGQDVKYLSLIPSHRSKLVAHEQFLDSVYLILNSLDALNDRMQEAIGKTVVPDSSGSADTPAVSILEFKKTLALAIGDVRGNLVAVKGKLASAKKNLPENLSAQADKAIAVIDRINQTLSKTDGLQEIGLSWLGDENSPKNLLVLFQNNTELRGGGGFIGSFAAAKFAGGGLRSLDFQTNINKLDNPFMAENKIPPPAEMLPFIQSWAMRDSNHAADFPESAKKVLEFYQMETGESMQGIVALDTTLFTRLLKIVGPIEMPEYDKVISEENFLREVQYEVEVGYFKRPGGKEENEPKKVLAEMMPKFIARLGEACRDKEKFIQITSELGRALKEKHLLLYVDDNKLQDVLEELNYAGKVEHRFSDFLYINNSNLGGGKSSLNIKESIRQIVNINAKGEINNKLELTREHLGSGEWPDGVNKNLVRILLPQESDEISVSGLAGNFWPIADKKYADEPLFKVDEEAGKAKAAYWQNIEPGQVSMSEVSYRTNYRVDTLGGEFVYRLYLQKQPGSTGDDFELEINYPSGWKPKNVKNYDYVNRKILIKDFFNEDREYSIGFERINR